MNTLRLLASILSLLVTSASMAGAWQDDIVNLPYVRDQERYEYQLPNHMKGRSGVGHRFEKHQYARTFMWVRPDGCIQVHTRFENGKRIDGDHFYAVTQFLDSDGSPVAVIRQTVGLNPRDKKWKRNDGCVPQRVLENIASVRVRYGHFDSVPDRLFWDTVARATSRAGGNWAIAGSVYFWGVRTGVIR